jgi:hypothetical protein
MENLILMSASTETLTFTQFLISNLFVGFFITLTYAFDYVLSKKQ